MSNGKACCVSDWDVTWKPNFGFNFQPEYHTLVSPYEDGGEQRRRKRTRAKHRFFLSYNNKDNAVLDAIVAFFKARYGAYESFNFPNFGQRIKGVRLACVDSTPDTITDSSNEFVKRGFDTTLDVWIEGSGVGNDGVYDVAGVAAGTITLDAAETLTAESVNADLIVYPCYVVRFNEDRFRQEFLTNKISAARTVELIEVI